MKGPYLTRFQIRDLEEFTGIKAHTIRMWEKRYDLLQPERTDTNIRYYDLDALKSLLNVAYLNQRGYKISRIASLSNLERDQLVKETALAEKDLGDAINTLKLAMLSFDESLFDSVSLRFRNKEGFRGLVEELYLPLLQHLGMLWQANAICPSHEHFISNLVRQKLVAEIDAIAPSNQPGEHAVVLFLPENEIHELGLLYVTYLVRAAGKRTIYLGQSVPADDLAQVGELYKGKLTFISFITAFPHADHLPAYLRGIASSLPMDRCEIWLSGGMVARSDTKSWPKKVLGFPHVKDLIAHLSKL
ncbi:MAG: MerR family transcriptional regulator [Flavobacteriales bacterium]|nr:MerR family transcriptional regulator [Flavobacteriales bacterium]